MIMTISVPRPAAGSYGQSDPGRVHVSQVRLLIRGFIVRFELSASIEHAPLLNALHDNTPAPCQTDSDRIFGRDPIRLPMKPLKERCPTVHQAGWSRASDVGFVGFRAFGN